MKTAMQELIDEVRRLRKNGFSVDDKYLQGLLEKEKEQIMNAFSRGLGTELGLDWEDSEQYYERIYNQTYNN
jgi:hypothetical protein